MQSIRMFENPLALLVAACALLLADPAAASVPCPPEDLHVDGQGGSASGDGKCASTGQTKSYTTEFDGTENPISEGGAWSNVGGDWNYVVTEDGIAHGTQSGDGGYDDSYAVLSGFAPDQAAWGRAYIAPGIDTSCNAQEVEILLRWSDEPGSARGYECMIDYDGRYAFIVRWNGPFGDFTILGRSKAPEFKDGDTVKATAIGDVITLYHNDTEIIQVTDDVHSDGNPGIGFYRSECGSNEDFGFASFTATDDVTQQVPHAE